MQIVVPDWSGYASTDITNGVTTLCLLQSLSMSTKAMVGKGGVKTATLPRVPFCLYLSLKIGDVYSECYQYWIITSSGLQIFHCCLHRGYIHGSI